MSTPGASDPSSLLTGDNAAFLDQLYSDWCRDPASVDPEWGAWFAAADGQAEAGLPTSAEGPHFRPRSIFHGSASSSGGSDPRDAHRQAGVAQLINAYRVRGHTEADIDPLGNRVILPHPELKLEFYGLGEDDLDVEVSGRPLFGVPEMTTLRTIVARLPQGLLQRLRR